MRKDVKWVEWVDKQSAELIVTTNKRGPGASLITLSRGSEARYSPAKNTSGACTARANGQRMDSAHACVRSATSSGYNCYSGYKWLGRPPVCQWLPPSRCHHP